MMQRVGRLHLVLCKYFVGREGMNPPNASIWNGVLDGDRGDSCKNCLACRTDCLSVVVGGDADRR